MANSKKNVKVVSSRREERQQETQTSKQILQGSLSGAKSLLT